MGTRITRRATVALLGVALVVSDISRCSVALSSPTAGPSLGGPQVSAVTGILVDASSGQVLWSKEAHRHRAIASTTKIVTALVVLERSHLTDVVTTSARAEAVGADDPLVTELELHRGEELTVEQLLYGLLLPSANDAAVALAEHVAGSVESFAALMNQKAKKLGAKDSHFVNANGSDDPQHYSSAADLALFARAALSDPTFKRIVATKSYTITFSDRSVPLVVENRNTLLDTFPGADGVKTGHTLAAGRALVASATRGSESRISVVLGSSAPDTDSTALLTYGFDSFRRFVAARKGQVWGTGTFGDGTSSNMIAESDLSMLVVSSQPDPTPRVIGFRRIELSDGAGFSRSVAVHLACRRCAVRSRGPMDLIWAILRPLALIAR